MDARELNSDTYASTANGLSTEPSPSHLNLRFLNNMLGLRFATIFAVIKPNVEITKHLANGKSF